MSFTKIPGLADEAENEEDSHKTIHFLFKETAEESNLCFVYNFIYFHSHISP